MVAVARNGDAFVASPPAGIRLFLLFGSDAGAVTERARRLEQVALKRGGGDQVLRLGSDELSADPGRIADEAYGALLFGGEPVVSLRILDGRHNVLASVQALLDRPPEAAWLIVEAGELKAGSALRTAFETCSAAAAVATQEADPADIAALVQSMADQAGVALEPEALSALSSVLSGDRLASRGEIEKLLAYIGDAGAIRLADVEAVIGETAEVRNGQIIDAALLGDAESVEKNLGRLRAEGSSLASLAAQSIRHVIALQSMRLAVDRGGDLGNALKYARPPIFSTRRAGVTQAVRHWRYQDLARARIILDSAVNASRHGPALEFSLVSDALHRIAATARRKGVTR